MCTYVHIYCHVKLSQKKELILLQERGPAMERARRGPPVARPGYRVGGEGSLVTDLKFDRKIL
jgi:hypothetical protein